MTHLHRMTAAAASCLALLAAYTPAAMADRDYGEHRHGDRHWEGHRWHGEIRDFHRYDFDRWRGGRWYRGPHAGRLGWWWIVGGAWYFYPQPAYPYPDPYIPPVALAPQIVVPAPAAPVAAPPPGPAAPSNWYLCDSPRGYYPYVPECPAGWHMVPAQPQQ